MSRKILYSPGYGAGWTTWHSGSEEEIQFMLTYPPFIEAIENGAAVMDPRDSNFSLDQKYPNSPLIQKFLSDWKERFPKVDPPYLGGLRGLDVAYVNGRVRINEYDGAESYEEEGKYSGWL